MNNARLLRLHLNEASAALGAANHATFRETPTVPDTYDLVGSLDQLTRRLPQLLGFLGRSIHRASGRLCDDRGRDPSEAVGQAVGALDAAVGAVDLVVIQLATAQNALGHLGFDLSED